jgi:hypothetical protein
MEGMRKLGILLILAALAPAQEEGGAGEEEAAEGGLDALGGLGRKPAPIAFGKVDRTIRKLPALAARRPPLYGLFLFGPDGRTRVWAVLDATGDGPYDLLYLDRNADGNLTAADERLAGEGGKFEIGDFTEPGTDVIHTGFRITWTKDGTRYRMKWGGGAITMGPFGPAPDKYADFAPSPAEAPIFVPGTERPFEFEHWMSGTLARGAETDFKVFLGNRGDRTGAFTCVDDKFLPKDEFVVAELRYRDGQGKERRAIAELKERC